MAGRFSVEAVFKAVDRVTAPVNRMQQRVGRLTRSLEANFRRLNRSVQRFGSGMKQAGRTAAAGLASAGAAMFGVLRSGASFEQAIVDVGAVGLKTRDQIADLEAKALDLGRTTKFTATEAANAMEIMARAGFTNQQILDGVDGVLNAAAASGLEMAEVSNVVSNALKGMGLEASEAGRVADVLALASARTNSSIGSLGESLKNVASTAKQLNVPFEDTVAAVALLQDVGLDASVAGSAFNTMLTKMAKPPAAVAAKMKEMGISFKDGLGNMKPLEQVLSELSVASEKAGGNFDRVAFFADLVGLRGQKAAANLADLFEKGKVKELTAELKKAKGSAEAMANLKLQSVEGQFVLLGSAIDGVFQRIFKMNNRGLADTVKRMREWVDTNGELMALRVGEFIGDIVDNLDEILLRARQVAGLVVAFTAFSFAVKAATMATTMLSMAQTLLLGKFGLVKGAVLAYNAVMTVLPIKSALATGAMWLLNAAMTANPVGLLVVGIGLLVAAIAGIGVVIAKNWDSITGFFDGILDKIKLVAAGAKKFGSIFGFTDDDEGGTPEAADGGVGADGTPTLLAAPQVTSPADSITRAVEESKQTTSNELIIKGDTDRVQLTGPSTPFLKLLNTGAD